MRSIDRMNRIKQKRKAESGNPDNDAGAGRKSEVYIQTLRFSASVFATIRRDKRVRKTAPGAGAVP